MGYWKNKQIEWDQRGFGDPGDKYVCSLCVEDDALARWVDSAAQKQECSYCGREANRPIAAPIEGLLFEFRNGLVKEWNHAIEELPYESREGGYQGSTYTLSDVLTFGMECPFRNEDLLEDVLEVFDDELWCQRDYFGLKDDDVLRFGWEHFAETVKHETRFLFTLTHDEHAEDAETISPGQFVQALGEVVDRVDLLTRLSPGTPVFRAREHANDERVETGSALGSPPIDRARVANRMSPAGIPLFYGSFDRATATAEIEPVKAGRTVTSGIFRLARPIVVVDLCDLPPIPSLFDRDPDSERSSLLFLHDFARDLAKPIDRDGRESYEYVPTQIITEYLRRVFVSSAGKRPQGILYRSSVRPAGKNCVLFFENDQCTESSPDWQEKHRAWPFEKQSQWWLGLEVKSVEHEQH